jgi:hypothetical protein
MAIERLLPPRLRERPTGDPVSLAHWYLSSQVPGGHLPCRPISDCLLCEQTAADFFAAWQREWPIETVTDPVEREARQFVSLWYSQGSSNIDVRFPGLPVFDAALVP